MPSGPVAVYDQSSRDARADWELYRFTKCPCETGSDLRLDELDGRGYSGSGALVERGLWCTGCGQPYLLAGDGRLIPCPAMEAYTGGVPFSAVRVVGGNCGPELAAPWPHSLWNEVSSPDRRGPQRVPALLRHAPE